MDEPEHCNETERESDRAPKLKVTIPLKKKENSRKRECYGQQHGCLPEEECQDIEHPLSHDSRLSLNHEERHRCKGKLHEATDLLSSLHRKIQSLERLLSPSTHHLPRASGQFSPH